LAGFRKLLIIPVLTAALAGLYQGLRSDVPARDQAYAAVEALAPWNIVIGYGKILFIPDDVPSEFQALRAIQMAPTSPAADTKTTFYLTRGASLPLRPIAALIDLLIHLLADTGVVGFLYTTGMIVLGASLFLWFQKNAKKGFYFYTILLPIGAVALASVAAVPFWLIALVGVFAFNAALGFCFHTGSLALAISWVTGKVTEAGIHEVVAAPVDAVAEKLEKSLKR
jgi:hypothetical protein